MKKIENILQIWFWPIWLLIFISEIGALFLFYYFFGVSKDYVKSWEIGLSSFLSLLTTSAGIFAPLWINRNWQKSAEKKEMIFALGCIWQELRSNLFVLEEMRVNYTFKLAMDLIPTFEELTGMVMTKALSIQNISKGLSDKYYLSTLNSRTFVQIDNDNVYNDISQSYENINILENALGVLCEDLKMKMFLINNQVDRLQNSDKHKFKLIYNSQLIHVLNEIYFCKAVIKNALKSIDTKLKATSVNTELVLRDTQKITELPDDASIIPDPEIIL